MGRGNKQVDKQSDKSSGASTFRQAAASSIKPPNQRWKELLPSERRVLLYYPHHAKPHDLGRVSDTSTGFVVDTLKKIATKEGAQRPQILSFIASIDLTPHECITLCALKTDGLNNLKEISETSAQLVECLASGYTPEETCEELKITRNEYDGHKRSIVKHLGLMDESYIVPMAIAHYINERRERNKQGNGSAPAVTQ